MKKCCRRVKANWCIPDTTRLLAIESVCAMIRVTQNILGDIAMTSALAGREKLLDETVYAG